MGILPFQPRNLGVAQSGESANDNHRQNPFIGSGNQPAHFVGRMPSVLACFFICSAASATVTRSANALRLSQSRQASAGVALPANLY